MSSNVIKARNAVDAINLTIPERATLVVGLMTEFCIVYQLNFHSCGVPMSGSTPPSAESIIDFISNEAKDMLRFATTEATPPKSDLEMKIAEAAVILPEFERFFKANLQAREKSPGQYREWLEKQDFIRDIFVAGYRAKASSN